LHITQIACIFAEKIRGLNKIKRTGQLIDLLAPPQPPPTPPHPSPPPGPPPPRLPTAAEINAVTLSHPTFIFMFPPVYARVLNTFHQFSL